MKKFWHSWKIARFLLRHPSVYARFEAYVLGEVDAAKRLEDNIDYIDALQTKKQQQDNYHEIMGQAQVARLKRDVTELQQSLSGKTS